MAADVTLAITVVNRATVPIFRDVSNFPLGGIVVLSSIAEAQAFTGSGGGGNGGGSIRPGSGLVFPRGT